MSESPKSPSTNEVEEIKETKETKEKEEVDMEDFEARRRKRKNKDHKKKEKKEEKEKKSQKKRFFSKDLRVMLYGFGDVSNPLDETIDLVEDIAIEYIYEVTQQAMTVCGKKGRLTTDDFVQVSKKEPKKRARVEELLRMYEELKKAKKAFETDESRLNEENNQQQSNL